MERESSLKTSLATSLLLIDNFLNSFEVQRSVSTQPTAHPSPLYLIDAASVQLKNTITKLSLLIINAPFTPSAVVKTLQALNNSILPSLVTACLLISPASYPEAFAQECLSLAGTVLRDTRQLLNLIEKRSKDGQPQSSISEESKNQVTEITGKIWEGCDSLLRYAKEDVGGFVARKARTWLELMKDAVKELEEWDPEEDDIDDQDWLGLEDEAQSGDEAGTHEKDKDTTIKTNRATISAEVKDQALKVLNRIPQSIHVVVKQRLEKYPHSSSNAPNEQVSIIAKRHRLAMNLALKKIRSISDCIDESAEAMYLGDSETCLKKAGEARALTIHVVEAVLDPWTKQEAETKEDQYIKKALTWIQQVDTTSASSTTQSKNS